MSHQNEQRRKTDSQPAFLRYIPLLVFVSPLVFGGIVMHADVRAQGEDLKAVKEDMKAGSVLVTEHKTVIPLIQKDIQELKQTVKIMSEKQDRQYEAIMQAVKQ